MHVKLTYPKKETNKNANDGSYILLHSKEKKLKKQSKKVYNDESINSTLSHTREHQNGKLTYKQCSQNNAQNKNKMMKAK
jgi:hypothetical protein